MKNPSVESVAGDQTQFPPRDFPDFVTRARFLPGLTYVVVAVDLMCRFRTRSRMFAFGSLAVAWEWLERTLAALGLSLDAVILWFHDMI